MRLIELLTAYKVTSPLPVTYLAIPPHLPDSCIQELHLGA